MNYFYNSESKDVIYVDKQTQVFLLQKHEESLGRKLSVTEKKEYIEEYINQELLVREARKQGLADSSKIRNLLIQNMTFFYTNDITMPSETVLERYYMENTKTFTTKEKVNYDHVFYSFEDKVPEHILMELENSKNFTELGRFFNNVSRRLYFVDKQTLLTTFGADNAEKISLIDDRRWHGPFTSNHGVHFLRVNEIVPPKLMSREELGSWVATEWIRSENKKVISRALNDLRSNYRIELEIYDEDSI